MTDILRTLERLFEQHAPETLMALFGAATSILLFYLVGSVLHHLFGLQRRSVDLEAGQDQVMAALVGALVTEAGHLRETLDSLLAESLQRSERNARLLTTLLAQAEQTPGQVVELLKPEFVQLHQAVYRAEERLAARLGDEPGETAAQTTRVESGGE